MVFRSYIFSFAVLMVLTGVPAVLGQSAGNAAANIPRATPSPTPTPIVDPKEAIKNPTAEQIAEATIFVYGGGGGRVLLNQIRRTAIERGRTSVVNAEGQMEQANYQKWTTRGDTLSKEKIRLDQEFPAARFSLVYNDAKTVGIFNDQTFTPRDDATRAFENQIFYNIDSLLRYKENESTLTLVGKDKIGGVDLHVVDLTDLKGRKMRYYISAKRFRVIMLDYEDAGVKYRRKFYDYNTAQGTLVPFRSVLYAGDKIVEETDIGTVTYGQKVEDGTFAST